MKGERFAEMGGLTEVLYHWSPAINRASIKRHGLRGGDPSNLAPQWSPPHVCYGETPTAALALTLLDVPLDLWVVRTSGHPFTLANDQQEWRTTHVLPAFYIATRDPRTMAEEEDVD